MMKRSGNLRRSGEETGSSSAQRRATAPALPATFADAARRDVGERVARRAPGAQRVRSEVGNDVRTESSADFSSEPVSEPRPEPRSDSRNERSSRATAQVVTPIPAPTPAARTAAITIRAASGYQPIVLPRVDFKYQRQGLGRVRLKARCDGEISPTGTLPVPPPSQRISRRMSRSCSTGLPPLPRAAEPLHEHEHALQAEVHHRDEGI